MKRWLTALVFGLTLTGVAQAISSSWRRFRPKAR